MIDPVAKEIVRLLILQFILPQRVHVRKAGARVLGNFIQFRNVIVHASARVDPTGMRTTRRYKDRLRARILHGAGDFQDIFIIIVRRHRQFAADRVLIVHAESDRNDIGPACKNVSAISAHSFESTFAADGNVLGAIIWLESQGKTQTTSAHAATESAPVDEPSAEMVAAQAAYEKSSEKTDFSKKMDSVWEYLKKLFRLSLDTKFIATRRDAIILNIPILIPIIALFAWGATIWLMLIGLFFGMRYRIDSDGDVPGSINNLMNHAADAADDIKQNLNDDK